jgi:outer membrane protein assembly factor BamB
MFRNGELQAGMLDGFVAYDPVSGEVQRKVANRIPRVSSFQCNASRATLSYLMTYSTVFTDNKGTAVRKFITRSTCGTGMFPANGMVYSTTNYCGCHTMLRGHMALASELPGEPTPDRKRLQTGMAADFADPTLWPKPDEWPAFMGGSERHCTTKGSLGKNLKLLWQVRVTEGQRFPDSSLVGDWLENDQNPGPALPPIVAEGLVVIATPESHTLHAFEAATGKPTWKFVAGGRVGTPTLYGGLCLFGSHDGWVYALRATDGRLAWRFLAAHNQRKMSAYSQLESPWPVASTVTILDGAAFVAAGRHPQADGGIQVYRLDPVSGNVHWKSVWTGPATDPLGDTGNSVINDVLVSDGKLLYLKALALNPATGQFGERVRRKGSRSDVLIFADKSEVPVARYPASRWGLITASPVGFGGNLNATHWALAGGKAYAHRAGVWNNPLQTKYLSCWADTVFSLDATKEKPVWLNDATRDSNRGKAEVNALVVAGDKVLVAGRDLARGYVEMFDAADGAKMGALDLPLPPVEKGLAVAYGRLYVSLRDGTLVCFGD